MSRTVSPLELASALRRMGEAAPEAVRKALVEGAVTLRGELVQQAIASSAPQPVDRGQYKAGWRMSEVAGGAVVFNLTPQALWMERGRAPGPVPLKPIRDWVRRKGFWRAEVKARRRDRTHRPGDTDRIIDRIALAVARKIAEQGIEPRWVLRRSVGALEQRLPGLLRRSLGEVMR